MNAVAAKSPRLAKLDNEPCTNYPKTEGVSCNGLLAASVSACRKVSQTPFPDFEYLWRPILFLNADSPLVSRSHHYLHGLEELMQAGFVRKCVGDLGMPIK